MSNKIRIEMNNCKQNYVNIALGGWWEIGFGILGSLLKDFRLFWEKFLKCRSFRVGRSLNTSAALFMIKVLSSRLYGGLECLRLPEKASGLHPIGPTASLSSLRHSGSPHSWEATLTRDNSNPLRVCLKFKFHRVQCVIFTHVGGGRGKLAFLPFKLYKIIN